MRPVLIAAAALLGLAIAASRAGTFLHEAAGHLAASLLFGGREPHIQVTLMGGGHAGAHHPSAPFADAVVDLAGIGVNALTGAICLALLWRGTRPPAPAPAPARAPSTGDLFLRVLAALSVFGALHYLIAGSYYGYGDPANFPRLWRVGIALAPPAFVLALLPLALRLRAGLPGGFPAFVAALALAGAGYAGLFVALKQDFAAIRAKDVAAERALVEARKTDPTITAADVKKPFPIEIALAASYAAAVGVAGVVAGRRVAAGAPGTERAPIDARYALTGLAAGAIALAAVFPLRNGIGGP